MSNFFLLTFQDMSPPVLICRTFYVIFRFTLHFEGLHSRNLKVCLLVSIDRSYVATPSGACLFALKI
jgi:hypothetical protein